MTSDRPNSASSANPFSSLLLFIPNFFFSVVGSFRSIVYDVLVLRMTTIWYDVVLRRLHEGSTILDIGIGTAGALIHCQDLLKTRNIRVVGIDYDQDYVMEAQKAIAKEGLQDYISVLHMSVYDMETRRNKLKIPGKEAAPSEFDAAYFSGSFSLLPDMCGALRVTCRLLQPKAPIYITQTYQRKSPPLLSYIKPLLRYITTIDFGQLIFEQEAKDLFYNVVPKECDLNVVEHDVIPGSLDTALQAAYLTILEPTYK
jgi:ubiquinone/menaquinone biosynthesis C-methylase UbiE